MIFLAICCRWSKSRMRQAGQSRSTTGEGPPSGATAPCCRKPSAAHSALRTRRCASSPRLVARPQALPAAREQAVLALSRASPACLYEIMC